MIYSDETRGAYEFDYQRLRDLEDRHAKQIGDFDSHVITVDDLEELEWLRGCLTTATERAKRREAEERDRTAFESRSETTTNTDPEGDLAAALRRQKNFRNRGIGRLIREEPVEVRKPGGGFTKSNPAKRPTRYKPSSQRGGLVSLKRGLG